MDVYLRLYGSKVSKPGRKIGHITIRPFHCYIPEMRGAGFLDNAQMDGPSVQNHADIICRY
jgi:hypothetical protein